MTSTLILPSEFAGGLTPEQITRVVELCKDEFDASWAGDWERHRWIWRLRTLATINPRPNQLTPDEHVLCTQSEEACVEAIRAADADFAAWEQEFGRGASPEERIARIDQRFTDMATNGHVGWRVALFQPGRGWGKTRVGAEDVSDFCRNHAGARVAGIFADFGDGRDVGVEGESGLLSVVPPSCIREWNRSLGEFVFMNESRFKIFSSEKPDDLRGPQHHRAWCEELAKWRYLRETWDQMSFGLRLGVNPQVVITTTPKPLAVLKDIAARRTTVTIKGSTFENARNLAPAMLAELRLRYENTRLGRQELYGEILDEYEGALWQRDNLDRDRVLPTQVPTLVRISIGIDPSTWGPEMGIAHDSVGRGIETGIIAVGISGDTPPQVYVLADLSARHSVNEWATTASTAWHALQANVVGVEKNVGGWVGSVLTGVDPSMHLEGIMARQGKRIRAEQIVGLYEQHRVHHVGTFAELEDQLCSWDPQENWSPDRLDALVHAISVLNPWHGAMVGSTAGLR